jgi:putative membrane protein
MRSLILCAAALAVVGACSKGSEANGDSAAAGASAAAATPAPPPAPAALTAENVVAKMGGGDSAEVMLARLVETKATNAGVKSYARMLVTDHGAHAKELAALEKKANLTPQPPPNDLSASEHQQTYERFKALSKGMDFDTAFVNDAVADHQKEITELQAAEQSIQQPEVKAFIAKTIPVMQKHLDRAQALQKQLSGGK